MNSLLRQDHIAPKWRVCAVAVLFHPQEGQLDQLLDGVQSEVQRIFLVDNTPDISNESVTWALSETVTYLPQGRNLGLAAAQNAGFRSAINAGYTHVLLLDQDSIVPAGMVRGLLAAEEQLLADDQAVAAVGAVYVDVKTGSPAVAHRYRPFKLEKVPVQLGDAPLQTDWLIASGSLIRCCVLKKVGLMREDLFIDAVDTEWGLRAKSMGLFSFLVPRVTMRHSIGDDAVRLLGRCLVLHNDVRSCYMVRNTAFLLRFPHMGWNWRSYGPISLILSFLTLTWTSPHPMQRARLLLRAIWDGLRGEMGALFGVH